MKNALALLLLAGLLLSGCATAAGSAAVSDAYNSSSLFAMDTYMELRVYGDAELLTRAASLIRGLESRLSVTDPGSEIYALNRDKRAAVSADTLSLLTDALALCRRTGGALDLSVYPAVRAWGFTTDSHRVPEAAELATLLENVDYTRIRLEGDTATLDEKMEIDLGSVAKGYTSGRVLDLFRESGVDSALLNLGGNVHALGAKPDGSPWRVAVQDPMGDGYLGVVEVADRAVITSGGYERCFEEDGVTYWHIIDPATGAPARSGLISVTVVGSDGLTCDGLSTALFVLGLEKAAQLWRESDDFEAIFVTEEGEISITQGLEGSFSLLGDYARREVTVIRRA